LARDVDGSVGDGSLFGKETTMNLTRIAIALGFVALLIWAVARPVSAMPEHPAAPGYFAGNLTPKSDWQEILKSPGVRAEFPMLGFGNMFAPITSACVDGDSVRIADPRSDTGGRLSAARVREQARASMGRDTAPETDRFAAAPGLPGSSAQPQERPIRFAVGVYKVVPTMLTPQAVFLFEKAWEIPTCGSQ
jgi:hypothetical protein